MSHPLRRLLAALTGAALVPLAACSTGATATRDADQPAVATPVESGAYPVTIEHALGTTTIEREPTRVVTIGWTEHDFTAALGVVPVGASKVTWGGNDAGSTEWFDARLAELGAEPPRRIDDADGVDLDVVAELQPDLILASNWDVTEQYRALSTLAPTVAFPEQPYTTSWQDSMELVGRALGRPTAATELVDRTEAALDQAAAAHPSLDGTTLLYAAVTPADLSKVDYLTPLDSRVKALQRLGLRLSPELQRLTEGKQAFYDSISAERADTLEADLAIVMPYDDSIDDELLEALQEDPLLSKIPAVARGDVYEATDERALLSISGPSVLSLPWAAEHLIPDIAAVADNAG